MVTCQTKPWADTKGSAARIERMKQLARAFMTINDNLRDRGLLKNDELIIECSALTLRVGSMSVRDMRVP